MAVEPSNQSENKPLPEKYQNSWGLGRYGELALACYGIAFAAAVYSAFIWLKWGFFPHVGLNRFLEISLTEPIIEWRGADILLRKFLGLHVSIPSAILGTFFFWREFEA